MPAFKFTGRPGEYLMGVPAHDLSEEDFAALTDEQKTLLEANVKGSAPVYELAKAATKREAARG